MYKTERLSAELDTKKYIDEYVNIEEFIMYCKECSNYGKKWSCPPYDFNVLDYWKNFNSIYILGEKITFNQEERLKNYGKAEIEYIMSDVLFKEKQKLTEELYKLEKQYEGSVSLSAGSCSLCGDGIMDSKNCTRVSCNNSTAKESCVHFDKMRYSIESLGGNVGKTCSQLLGINLEWVQENKLPAYFVLVCGLLKR